MVKFNLRGELSSENGGELFQGAKSTGHAATVPKFITCPKNFEQYGILIWREIRDWLTSVIGLITL